MKTSPISLKIDSQNSLMKTIGQLAKQNAFQKIGQRLSTQSLTQMQFFQPNIILDHVKSTLISQQVVNTVIKDLSDAPISCFRLNESNNRWTQQKLIYQGLNQFELGMQKFILQSLKLETVSLNIPADDSQSLILNDTIKILVPVEEISRTIYDLAVICYTKTELVNTEEYLNIANEKVDQVQILQHSLKYKSNLGAFELISQFTLNNIFLYFQCELNVSQYQADRAAISIKDQTQAIGIIQDKADQYKIIGYVQSGQVALHLNSKEKNLIFNILNVSNMKVDQLEQIFSDLEINVKDYQAGIILRDYHQQEIKLILNKTEAVRFVYNIGVLMNFYLCRVINSDLLTIDTQKEDTIILQNLKSISKQFHEEEAVQIPVKQSQFNMQQLQRQSSQKQPEQKQETIQDIINSAGDILELMDTEPDLVPTPRNMDLQIENKDVIPKLQFSKLGRVSTQKFNNLMQTYEPNTVQNMSRIPTQLLKDSLIPSTNDQPGLLTKNNNSLQNFYNKDPNKQIIDQIQSYSSLNRKNILNEPVKTKEQTIQELKLKKILISQNQYIKKLQKLKLGENKIQMETSSEDERELQMQIDKQLQEIEAMPPQNIMMKESLKTITEPSESEENALVEKEPVNTTIRLEKAEEMNVNEMQALIQSLKFPTREYLDDIDLFQQISFITTTGSVGFALTDQACADINEEKKCASSFNRVKFDEILVEDETLTVFIVSKNGTKQLTFTEDDFKFVVFGLYLILNAAQYLLKDFTEMNELQKKPYDRADFEPEQPEESSSESESSESRHRRKHRNHKRRYDSESESESSDRKHKHRRKHKYEDSESERPRKKDKQFMEDITQIGSQPRKQRKHLFEDEDISINNAYNMNTEDIRELVRENIKKLKEDATWFQQQEYNINGKTVAFTSNKKNKVFTAHITSYVNCKKKVTELQFDDFEPQEEDAQIILITGKKQMLARVQEFDFKVIVFGLSLLVESMK
ncbi:Hypothetical_protein [Hexamita inflata]|uniref:Hypothetical_protein n=1 Tax=Hexamita inflata TaxID=28002 RepID=A0AA86TX56_9EUKA|nr:Hypothetical protein HINF_LOCUS19351 [Hexamita inflata]